MDSKVGRRKRDSVRSGFQEFGGRQRGENRRIGLDCRGLLALSQEGALGLTVVLLEEVVDEVRGKRDQVDEEQTRRECAHGWESPGAVGPLARLAHRGAILHDFFSTSRGTSTLTKPGA